MAQFADGSLLDLTYSLSRHFQLFPHFLQCVVMIVLQAETQFDNLSFVVAELIKHGANLFPEYTLINEFRRLTFVVILDDITERIFVFPGKWSIQREDFFSPDQQLIDTIRGRS